MKSSSRGQLRKGNRPWEGSLGKTCEPTNRNRIRGRMNRESWHNTAKPIGLSSSGNQRMKLIVNEVKSKVVELSEAEFLGFGIIKRKVRWTRKSEKRFKKSVRMITKRTRGVSPIKVIRDLQLYTRGAINYYMPGLHFKEARDLDQWMRRRMRLYYWKQWGRPRTRRRNLLRLGIRRTEVHKASRSRKGPWRLTNTSIVTRAMTNQWLSDQGVPSIEQQWIKIRYPDGPKPKSKGRSKKVRGDLKV